MSFDQDPDAHLNIYGGRVIENKYGNTETGVPISMLRQRLIEQLASTLAHDAVTVTEDRYTKTHDLRVYVMTSSQLEKYVQRRAERLYPGGPAVRFEPQL